MNSGNLTPTPLRAVPRDLPSEYVKQPDPAGAFENEQAPGPAASIVYYLRVVVKYRLLIAAVTLAACLIALIYCFTSTPLYTAKSRIKIGTYEPILTATKIEDLLHEKSRESTYLETKVQELSSLSLADQVLSDQPLRDALFKQKKAGFWDWLLSRNAPAPSEPSPGYRSGLRELEAYLETISIAPVRRTSLVEIRVSLPDANLAARVANQHAQTYIDWVREHRIDQQSRGLAFLRTQADELRQKVIDLERELADYAESHSIVAVNKDQNITAQRMAQLNRLLSEATAKRVETENLYKEAEAALSNPSAGFDDSSTQLMRTELAKLEAEYQQLASKYTASYPRMQQLQAQIEGLRQSIVAARRQIVLGLKAKMAAALQEEKNLIEELERQKSLTFELSKRQVHYNMLDRELASSRELLQNVLRQIKETSLTVESNTSSVSIVDMASAPYQPSWPRKKLIILVGLGLGLLAGLGLALLLDQLDSTVHTSEELVQILQVPTLGVVPTFEEERGPSAPQAGSDTQNPQASAGNSSASALTVVKDYKPAVFVRSPKSIAAEAYRTIRTAILLSQAGEPPRRILVTSSQPSEGKTTTILNLAASLASSGGRVVLVDGDLRKPMLHRHLNLEASRAGLVEVLTSQATLAQVIQHDVIQNVSILPSGTLPPNPAELLGSNEMAALLDKLSQEYDYVLLDAPPVLPVSDAAVLARLVDGVVFVVRASATPRKAVLDAKTRLRTVGARILGTVLNDLDAHQGEYAYYQRYYHSYYRHEETPTEEAKGGSAAI